MSELVSPNFPIKLLCFLCKNGTHQIKFKLVISRFPSHNIVTLLNNLCKTINKGVVLWTPPNDRTAYIHIFFLSVCLGMRQNRYAHKGSQQGNCSLNNGN